MQQYILCGRYLLHQRVPSLNLIVWLAVTHDCAKP